MIVTEEEWKDWKQHEVTKAFFKSLDKEREKIKEEMVLGLFEDDGVARGMARCLLDLREMKYSDFREVVYE